jgi:hypothetical protein
MGEDYGYRRQAEIDRHVDAGKDVLVFFQHFGLKYSRTTSLRQPEPPEKHNSTRGRAASGVKTGRYR